MANEVTVNFNGNVQPLAAAANQGAQVLNAFGGQAQRAGQQAAAGMQQAAGAMGAMQQQLQGVGAQMGAPGSGADGGGGSGFLGQVGQLNHAFGLLGINLGGSLQGFLALDPEIAAIAIPVGLLFKGVTDLGGGILDLGQKLVEIPFDLFQTGVEDSIRLVEQLTDRLVQLAEQGVQQAFSVTEMSEKNLVNWAFLWGGVNTQAGTPGYGTGPGLGPANELLQWSKQQSLKMPWTRQDLMAAITTLSGEPGKSVGDIEHDLTLISDIAATQGRPGITLNWAAMAALRGDQGQRRMLLYELKLTPEELAKYGYDETDNTTFYPALEAYAKSRGSFGASDFISTQTFWGAQTSAIDRLQNFGMSMMGWNDNPQGLTDDVKKGSPFWYIKKDLSDLAAWFDSHQSQLDEWGKLISSALGGGLQLATETVGGLGDALQKSGLTDFLKDSLTKFGDFLNDPKTQQAFTQIGEVVGGILGPGLQDMGAGIQAFMDALAGTGVGQTVLGDLKDFGAWLQSPEGKAAFQDFGHILGDVVGQGLKTAWDMGTGFVTTIKGFLDGVGKTDAVDQLVTSIKQLGDWFRDPQHEEDLRHFGTMVGIWVGTEFSNAVLEVKLLAQEVGSFMTLVGDAVAVFEAWQNNGPMSKEFGIAMAKFGVDYVVATKQNTQAIADTAAQQAANIAAAMNQNDAENARHDQVVAGVVDAAGNPNNPLAAAQRAHRGLTSTQPLQQAGQQSAQAYLTAFKTTMDGQAPQTMNTAVLAYTSGMQSQLKNSGSTLARDLSDYIAAAVQQGIADALRTMRITGNNDLRQPGAFRSGGIGLGSPL